MTFSMWLFCKMVMYTYRRLKKAGECQSEVGLYQSTLLRTRWIPVDLLLLQHIRPDTDIEERLRPYNQARGFTPCEIAIRYFQTGNPLIFFPFTSPRKFFKKHPLQYNWIKRGKFFAWKERIFDNQLFWTSFIFWLIPWFSNRTLTFSRIPKNI